MPTIQLKPLESAIAEGAAVVLSFTSDGGLVHRKSRLLGQDENGLWTEAVGHELVDESIASGAPVGVSFRADDRRHVFASALLGRNNSYALKSGRTVPALRLATPAEVRPVQRRRSCRVSLEHETELAIRCWRMGKRDEVRDRPSAAQELPVRACDISEGGAGVIFTGDDGTPPIIDPAERLRIELRYHDTQLLVEGRVRPDGEATGNTLRTGIRFHFRDELDDRQTRVQLAAMVAELQRQEIRYQRAFGEEPAADEQRL